MKNFANFLVVFGVCVGALGASGFHTPSQGGGTRENNALTLFALGTTALAVGGYITLQGRRATAAPGVGGTGKRAILAEIEAIQAIVTELDAKKHELGPHETNERIGALLAAEYFDLTSKSDELIQLIGFNQYARIWDGVAVAERLLARAWSMYTDGHPDEAAQELPLARAALDNAVEAMRGV